MPDEVIDGPSRRCRVCGRPPTGYYEISVHDEVTCVRHPVMGRCVLCDRPHAEANPIGWAPFVNGALRCPTCVVDAVETQEQARALLPAIRTRMATIGVRLAEQVRVRVVTPREINKSGAALPSGGVLMGLTDMWIAAGGPVMVSGIRVVAGLPPTFFGRAVAHEIGHAWLAQYGRKPVDPAVEEGLCELFAHAWLRRERSALAESLRSQLRTNPDPIYGGGFRSVFAAVEDDGIEAVLTSLLTKGAVQ